MIPIPDFSPPARLGERLDAAREEAFTGRAAHLAAFRDALEGGPVAVLFVHGPGGIGKTSLLRRYAREARGYGRHVVRIDGRSLVPSPGAFGSAAAAALDDPRAVLLVDDFERCQGLEEWLSESFLPRLPATVLTVIAGRQPPGSRWSEDAGWARAMRVLPLGNLREEEARSLLHALGVAAPRHEALLRVTGGHPLALGMAARLALGSGDPLSDLPGELPGDVLRHLLDRLVGEVPTPGHRRALEVCAHVLDTTQALLRTVLPDQAGELFAWLRRQPYIVPGRHGLHPHDLVRDLLDADLRWRDPDGYQEMHEQVRAYLVERARTASGAEVLPATLALSYLHRHNGFVARFITWRGDGGLHEDALLPADRTAVLSLVERAEGARSAAVAAFWLERQPSAFRVYRTVRGEPVAVLAWLRLEAERQDEVERDPVVAAAWEHVRARRPLRPGEEIGVARFLVHPAAHERPSPAMDLMIHRVLAQFIHGRRLAWSFTALRDPFWGPLMAYIDQRALPRPVLAGDRPTTLYAHDWRAVPVGRWLEFSGTVELGGPAEPPIAGSTPRRRPAFAVLTREQFAAAVTQALQDLRRPDRLAAGPLMRTRLVAGAEDGRERLRELLTSAIGALAGDPRTAKLHRALATAYLHAAPTQEAGAERLAVSLSTYRRHLARGTELIIEELWERELREADA
ncbi:ATP-binding protein [Nonomuraea sp. FMUSA5-5]|uniref:ATP-binding protein n=1 Tax=Nonomuraea composti TaxID=2720023 RepID=A0ABX1BFJ3_9ACTN|nr:ATP-binding protein [Nonomuraea sp. FMUSA5-5]